MHFDFDWAHNKEVLNTDGRQSKLHRDWTLVPWNAMAAVVPVLEQGAEKYGRDTWQALSVEDHTSHLMEHAIAAHVCSDDTLAEIEHLTHVVCRALFALDTLISEVQDEEFRGNSQSAREVFHVAPRSGLYGGDSLNPLPFALDEHARTQPEGNSGAS